MHLFCSSTHNFAQAACMVLALVTLIDAKAISTTASPDCIFEEIPQSLPIECTALTIQNADLEFLRSSHFFHLNRTNIRTLTLSNNGITQIDLGNLRDIFPELEHLDVSHNAIKRLDSGAFRSLGELKSLYLQGNEIRRISSSAFSGLGNLQVLRLDENQLTTVDSSFSHVPDLKTLNLTSNNIAEITSNAFEGLGILHYLFLAYNNLTVIPEALMGGRLRKLHILNVRSNFIQTTLTASHLHYDYLEELYLTNNDIPDLTDDVFKYLRRLQVLHLDYNRLTDFNAYSTLPPQELHEIKLDNNNWDCSCNNTHTWDLLGKQNLTIVDRYSTFCFTPSSKREEVVFSFSTTCEGDTNKVMTATVKGIIAAVCIFLTSALIISVIFVYRRKCRKMITISPAKTPTPTSPSADSHAELPNHTYHTHIRSPTEPLPTVTNLKNNNGNLVAGDSATLRSHIYDAPEFQEALNRDPSYINSKVLRMNLQKSGITMYPRPSVIDDDSDTDAEYYLVPTTVVTKNVSRNDSGIET